MRATPEHELLSQPGQLNFGPEDGSSSPEAGAGSEPRAPQALSELFARLQTPVDAFLFDSASENTSDDEAFLPQTAWSAVPAPASLDLPPPGSPTDDLGNAKPEKDPDAPGGGNGGGGGGNGGGGGGGKGGGKGGGGGPTEPPTATTPFWSTTLGDADADGVDHYNITIEFYGTDSLWGAVGDAASGFSGGFIDAFVGAAEFLTSMIRLGYGDSGYTGPYADIEAGQAGESRNADDLVIEAYLTDIDGTGGILGRAGPYDLPDADGDEVYEGFPTAGLMEFDSADAADLLDGAALGGLWNDTVLHEMMHVVGFGTLWDQPTEGGTVSGWDALVGDQIYVDDQGTANPFDDNRAYLYSGDTEATAELAGHPEFSGNLWVEADGGAGTARGHWDEGVYDNEIMTGYINSLDDGMNAGANYMADFTVAAFADLGYTLDTGADGQVNYDAIAASGTHFLETGEVLDWTTFA
ncbi:hypothetical protein SAMN05421757_105342 [Tropicimonas sediminicola]|uniref:Leishmanolysin n=2 Tax=Tropicimonas sediminicola TaxID=1031541 RepID=A0A239JL78_9RHOB|nr:hypothetical protein SAMN05421757_105342 [Tropicimonas sediminicola]